MIWPALRRSGSDFWDEILLLMIFNIVWVLGTIPGLYFILRGVLEGMLNMMETQVPGTVSLVSVVVGIIAFLPWPFVTFGLFAVAYDIGQGKGIKFRDFFSGAARLWKQAYIWAGINLGLMFVAGVNIVFYNNFGTQWATMALVVVLGLTMFWGVLQLFALAIYPRLEEPSFKLVTRNATILFGRYPLVGLLLAAIVVLIAIVSFFAQLLVLLGTFSMIAIITNRMVEAMIKKALPPEETKSDE